MIRTMLLASTLSLALTGGAFAEGGPHIVGGGNDQTVVYDAPSENVVGGGFGRIVGEGNSRSIVYAGPTTSQASNGLIAEITGEANSRHVTYRAPTQAPAPTGLAGVRSSGSGS